jgi:hypothetical protein
MRNRSPERGLSRHTALTFLHIVGQPAIKMAVSRKVEEGEDKLRVRLALPLNNHV